MSGSITTIDEYIDARPPEIQAILRDVRRILHEAVPGAEEKIRYDMPAIMLGGRYAIHFAAWKKHLGLYPVPVAEEPLESEIAPYRTAKDTVRFFYAKPIPYELITRIAEFVAARRQSE